MSSHELKCLLLAAWFLLMPNLQFVPDSDPAFIKVDTRLPAHELPEGTLADAVNKRFEDGRAWPRYGVNIQPWGRVGGSNLVSGNYANDGGLYQGIGRVSVNAVALDHTYFVVPGNATQITDASQIIVHSAPQVFAPAGRNISAGFFVSQTGALFLWGPVRTACTAEVYLVQTPRAFKRWPDPNSVDTLILVTDDWRDGVGEDGGRGRAFRVVAGDGPLPISLNGHDVFGEARLVPCLNGLVLLRQDDERHYFPAANVSTTNSTIQLNCVPAWNNGDLVEFVCADAFSSITTPTTGGTPPQTLTDYFVKNVTGSPSPSGQMIELFADPGLTQQLNWASGTVLGRFYLERVATSPGYYGNGSPPLIMQPGAAGVTAFQAGFLAVPLQIYATAFDSTALVLTVPNHRLVPGDQVSYAHTNNTTETFYVFVVSVNSVMLYQSLDKALAGGLANAQTPSPAFTSGDFIKKTSASGLPMPPGREGAYLPAGRLIIASGKADLPISDPLDPLHFAPVAQTITANLGESDKITSLMPLGDDVVGKDNTVVAKQTVLLRLIGLSGPSNGWQLKEITREYGFIAPLATIRAGADVWGFSREGVVSIQAILAAIFTNPSQPAPAPVSYPMKKYIDMIDWPFADQICADTWNNRAYIAVPLKGQLMSARLNGRPLNNGVLVYNFLNQGWEGLWQGPGLQVYDWARHIVYGEERMAFVNYQGTVCWLGDGWTDTQMNGTYTPIADSMLTRLLTKGDQSPKLWLKGRVTWDTHGANLTVTAIAPGYNQSQVALQIAYDPTQYSVYGKAAYSPTGGNYNAPDRDDYSQQPGELFAGPIDIHQNWTENLRFRLQAWGVQFLIQSSSGSARVQSLTAEFVPTLKSFSRKT